MEKKKAGSLLTKRIVRILVDSDLSVSILSILITLAMLGILSAVYGADPREVIGALIQGALGGHKGVVSTLSQMAPLILTALAVYIPYKAGFFNIGGQGQLELSALAAAVVATNVNGSPIVVITVSLLTAILVGMCTVLIPLILKLTRGVNEVTTTIMMNFTCTNLVYALITSVLKDPDAFYGTTRAIPEAYRLAQIPQETGVHLGIYMAVIVSLFCAWYLKNTTAGLRIRAVGLNPETARTSGISVTAVTAGAVLAGAAMAGLAGGIQVLGLSYRVAEGWAMDWGFTGVSVAFLGANPVGIIPVAFLLAIIETGARYMQAMTSIPSAMMNLMQGIPVIVFVSLAAWRRLRKIRSNSDLVED